MAPTVLYASWYADGVRSFDISDPANPRPMGFFIPSGRPKVWSVAAKDDIVAISDIQGGLHLLKPSLSLLSDGRIHVDLRGERTAVSIANPGDQPATVMFLFTDASGRNSDAQTAVIPPTFPQGSGLRGSLTKRRSSEAPLR